MVQLIMLGGSVCVHFMPCTSFPTDRITQQLPPSTTATTQPAAAPVLGASLLGGIGSFTLNATPFQTQPGGPAMKIQPVSPLGSTGLAPLAGTSGVQVDPLAVLNDLFVPQETIQPGMSGVDTLHIVIVESGN